MKKLSTYLTIALFAAFGLNSFAQNTAGSLAFSVTTASTGNFSPKHCVAIWVETSTGTFVKTLLRNANTRKQYIGTWVSQSGQDVTDAITGSTLTTHGTLNVTWNGTNVSQAVVADGSYRIAVQMAWANSQGPVSYFTFTKGTSISNPTLTGTTNYVNPTLTWTPTATGVEENVSSIISVFPNPASNMLSINLGDKAENTEVTILNMNGQVVSTKSFDQASGNVNIDITDVANGVYFVNVRRNNIDTKAKFFVVK